MKNSKLTRWLRPINSNSTRIGGITSQSGQAITEYILLIVIVMAMTFGVIYQFSTAFQAFAKSYFGDYLTCLLEAGELPSVGSGISICSASYAPFTLEKGRPFVGSSGARGGGSGGSGPGGSGGESGSGSSTSKNPNNRNLAKSGEGPSSASEGQSAAGRIVPGDGGGRGSRNGGRFVTDANSSSTKSKRSDGLVDVTSADTKEKSFKLGGAAFNSAETGSRTSGDDQAMGRVRFLPPDKKDKSQSLKPDKVALNDADTKPRGARVPGSSGVSLSHVKDSDVGMTFPNFIRFMLIAAIVIALVLFLGGQAMAIKKGSDKS